MELDAWLVGGAAAAVSALLAIGLRAAVRAQRRPVETGIEWLVGRDGVTESRLDPAGTVRVDGELWTAVAAGDAIEAGEPVQVVRVEGATLHVIER